MKIIQETFTQRSICNLTCFGYAMIFEAKKFVSTEIALNINESSLRKKNVSFMIVLIG